MSTLYSILGGIILILTVLAVFNGVIGFFGSLLCLAIGLLQFTILLPWILLEKITGIETPSWVMRLVDTVECLNPGKWIK